MSKTKTLDETISRLKEKGKPFLVHESQTFVSVETTGEKRDWEIYRKSNGQKVSSFKEMTEIFHTLIKHGHLR